MKVGDYVRFKDKRSITYIRKIVELPQDTRYGAIKIDIEANYSDMLSPKNIIKSSPNIIDLIEVGDYVNGYLVLDIAYSPHKALYLLQENNCGALLPRENNDIKSIVTKEQFESMEYKVND